MPSGYYAAAAMLSASVVAAAAVLAAVWALTGAGAGYMLSLLGLAAPTLASLLTLARVGEAHRAAQEAVREIRDLTSPPPPGEGSPRSPAGFPASPPTARREDPP